MNILELQSTNVRNVKSIRYEFVPGQPLVIGGKNHAGKSSSGVDALAFLLKGASSIPGDIVRRGTDQAEVIGKFSADPDAGFVEPIKIERIVSKSGKKRLEITTESGYIAPEPQEICNRIWGDKFADPTEFIRLPAKEQVKYLKELVGIDTEQMDLKRKKLYDQRTEVGRQKKHAEGALEKLPYYPDCAEEIDVSSVADELERAQDANRDISAAQQEYMRIDRSLPQMRGKVARMRSELQAAEEELAAAERKVSEYIESPKPEAIDTAEIKSRLSGAREHNQKFQANQSRSKQEDEAKRLKSEYDAYTKQIDEIDEAKATMLKEAKWPVPGMGFDDDGVTLNGFRIENLSTAQGIDLGLDMSLAKNPTLKLFVIRHGSLLDEHYFQTIVSKVADRGGDLLIEVVGDSTPGAIIIEDGEIASR